MEKITLYAACFMAVIYLSIGVLFIFTDVLSETFSQHRLVIGILFSVYGLFRGIICWQKLKS